MKVRYWVVALAAVLGLIATAGAAARTDLAAKPAVAAKAAKTKVTLQLKWVTQAQFAGYYAAKAKGYYSQAGLDVNIKLGGPTITPEQVVLGKQAEFGIDWLPSLLSFRDGGKKIVNIAQVFSKSGMTELSWKDSGITSIAKMRGKKVGVWCCGNENELYAALVKNGIDPKNKDHVTIVNQPFDMNLFLNKQVDAAAAMTYNELAQVLEQKNPKTGKLYKLSDLNVIKMEDGSKGAGTSMLEDGIFVRDDWIKSKANQATAKKFLAASFKGWIYCRDHWKDCVSIVLRNGPALPKGHQTWQMNEINALIWPNKLGIGVMDAKAFNRTARIAKQFKVIKKSPSGAYRTDLAKAAVAQLKAQGVNVTGRSWKKAAVKVTAGGK
jgi:NitT/TauT family transport system substrate-binding protein